MSGIKYQARLDGLRFIAIFMVLIEHFAYYIGQHISAGFYGVNLFFVISGFLITSILIKDHTETFKGSYLRFLGRRALRIFPIYYLCIFLIWLLQIDSYDKDLPYLLTYTYNYHLENTKSWSNIYSLYWSLSVEEQFYIFFPLIVLALRKKLKALLIVCLIIMLIAAGQILFDIFSLAKYNYVGLLTNMWPLTLGATGAVLWKQNIRFRFIFNSKLIELFVLLTLGIILTLPNWEVKIIVCPLLNLFLVLKAYHYKFYLPFIDRFLGHRWIVFTGRISYGIYVYHGFISYYLTVYFFDPIWKSIPFDTFGTFGKVGYHPWLLKLPLYTIITIVIAFVSYKFIEAPILKLKDRLFAAQ
ncbi:MAG TPA: acyltransferase [Lacibacter sp.]|nr:acyltransferase [Lacibacter sp.]